MLMEVQRSRPFSTSIPQVMATQRRKFTEEEKMNVLQQASQQGISHVLRQYNISYSVFARWKQNFLERGINPTGAKTEHRQLLEENARLKKIIADLALSLELKDEELRRVSALHKKNDGLISCVAALLFLYPLHM